MSEEGFRMSDVGFRVYGGTVASLVAEHGLLENLRGLQAFAAARKSSEIRHPKSEILS